MNIKEDFKNLNGMVKQMNDQIKLVEDVVDDNITDIHGLNIGVKDVINKLNIETIETMEEHELIRKLHDGGCDDSVINSLREMNDMVADDEEAKPFVEYLKEIFKDIRESLDSLNDLYTERDKILSQISEASDNYFNFINSDEYQEKKNKKLAEIKEKAEKETDTIKKKKLLINIEKLEKAESLQFLFDRIEKYGDKEVSNIVDIFFDKKRSELVMTKFTARLPKFGYEPEIYKYFFNFEEKFLSEEYHDLNNIFLFVVMRFISFGDINSDRDSVYVSSILLKMYNLLYHKYSSKEKEDAFIDVIKRMDNYFLPYMEKFKEKNTTSPKHPERIKRDAEYEEKIRIMLIASLENEGIKIDEPLETDVMRQMLKDVMEKKQKESSETKNTPKPVEEVIKEANEVPDSVSESDFGKMMNEVSSTDEYDELEKIKEDIDLNSLKETAVVVDEVKVWSDKFGKYYSKNEDNTYTYHDVDDTVIETVSEETVLKLISSGSLIKVDL